MKLKSVFGQVGKFVEFKSWKTGSFSLLNGAQYKNQLKAYMKSGSFEQIFDAKKLIADGIADPDKFIKQKIVDMIKKNAEEFWNDDKVRQFFVNNNLNNVDKLKTIDINSNVISNFKAK